MTAPAIRPSTTTIAKGTMNQTGLSPTSGPREYEPMASLRDFDEPASNSPKRKSTATGSEAPIVVQATTARPLERRGRYRE